MIKSREDYEFYLEADKIALGIGDFEKPTLKNKLIKDLYDIWRFERLLRKLEYYINCKHSWFWDPYVLYLKWKFKHSSLKMGFSIPPNVFGPGLSIAHPGTIIVNGYVRVGENCRIHNCVQLVTAAGSTNACPKIGDNVFIGPGAVIIGDIEIADGIVIGANSVVNKSFPEREITIAGTPAKKISYMGSGRYYHRATDVLRTGGPNPAELILSDSKLHADDKNSDIYLVVRNIGNITWTKNSLLRIGTAQERDRPSAYYHPSWISPNRVCTFSEDQIAPHETATFNFTISTNGVPPSEMFQLVLENKRWIPKTEFEIYYKKQ